MIWVDTGSPRLGVTAQEHLAEAERLHELAFSVVSVWEVGTLLRKKRLVLNGDLRWWRADWIEADVTEIDLIGPIVLRAESLDGFHPDPADRFIVATALVHGATLITADEKILDWGGPLRRLDARS